MKTRQGWVQGYIAQTVVTPQQIILAAEVTTDANDVQQLKPMLDLAQAAGLRRRLAGGGGAFDSSRLARFLVSRKRSFETAESKSVGRRLRC